MGKILSLNNGARAGSPLRVQAKSQTEAEIVLYAGIGQDFWGDGSMISAKQFSDELKKLPDSVQTLNIRINSPGGDVFDGISIYNRLKQHKARKVVYIDGLAASIASIIALAGDEVLMGEGALYMVHLPWTFAVGNRTDLDNTVGRLMDVEEQMLGIYARRTKLERAEIRKLLEDETWMDSTQAISLKFADKVASDTVAMAASAMKSAWIKKPPQKYFSDTEAVKEKLDSVKQDVAARLSLFGIGPK